MFTDQIPIFQEHIFFGSRTDTDFPGALFWATKQIAIFQNVRICSQAYCAIQSISKLTVFF